MGDLSRKASALQLNFEGLLKLLGGSERDRERFWEIFKGITTPRENALVSNQLDTLAGVVKQVTAGVKNLQGSAQKIAQAGGR
jgi:hypothetical protein